MQGEVECSVDDWECGGVNVWIMFFRSLMKVPSNFSNFIVERTKISYGVNLTPKEGSFMSSGSGIVILISSPLEYDVQIAIAKCSFMNNIAPYAAHLHLKIYSSCSLLVKYSNFTYANRITEGNPMELVPQVYPDMGTLMLYITDNIAAPIDVEIVINEVQITENVGGGLFVSLLPQLPQSNVQLKLKDIEVTKHRWSIRCHFSSILTPCESRFY